MNSSNSSMQRLLKEYKSLKITSMNPIITHLEPVSLSDLFRWQATINGPFPYSGSFKLDIRIPHSYPIDPPIVKFITKVCHPNIHFGSGKICLDILTTSWTAAWTLESLCLAIHQLLQCPDPSSPLNCDAANLLRANDQRGYNSLVKFYCEMYSQVE